MKRKIMYILGVWGLLTCGACTDWLTIQPETSMTAETLFATDDGVQQGLNGAYYIAQYIYGPTSAMVGGGIVEMMANTYSFASGTDGYLWSNHTYGQTDSQENVNKSAFMQSYNLIANLNSLINEMVKNRDDITPEVYAIVRGEAFALRACAHLDLLRVYGPVPSKADPAKTYLPYVRVNSNENYEYHTFDQFMDYVQADLDSAEFLLAQYEPVLTTSFSNTEYTTAEWPYRKSRLNYYGVLGLQARAALWRGDKTKALQYAKLVKDASYDSYGTMQKHFRFTTPSDDVTNYYTTDKTHYTEHICGVKCDNFYFDQSSWSYRMLSLYNVPEFGEVLYGEDYANDLRYQHFWRTGTGSWYDDEGNILPEYRVLSITIGKYSDFSSSTTSGAKMNSPIVRLPEMYFIIMECGTLEEANAAYEEYCAARNISYEPLTENDRQDRVILESVREYVGEGQNLGMYKRNNVKRMVGATTDCTEEQYIVPIPEAEFITEK